MSPVVASSAYTTPASEPTNTAVRSSLTTGEVTSVPSMGVVQLGHPYVTWKSGSSPTVAHGGGSVSRA
jgi:hypothetical protein